MQPIRSLFNTPGSRPDLIEKAPNYGADAYIIDLEDAVPKEQKAEARTITHHYVEDFARRGLLTYVRVNDASSGYLADDLAAVVRQGLVGIQLPKASAPSDVRVADELLGELERDRGLPSGSVEVVVSLETAAGIFHAHAILTAAPRVGSLVIGTAEGGDLQGDLGYELSADESETLFARSFVLLAARVAGVTNPLDGVFADYRNVDGLEQTSRRARRLGYRGKKVIHPSQVEVVNRVFAPTAEEIEHHEQVLESFQAALTRGEATAVVDGKMIDYAMAETARSVLARAGALRDRKARS